MSAKHLALLALAALSAACRGETPAPAEPGPEPLPPPRSEVDARLVQAYTGFGLRLFERLAAEKPRENVVLAPASVAFALAMTYHGAAGETQAAMARTLELGGMTSAEVAGANAAWRALLTSPDPKVELAIANSLWAREGVPFLSSFLQLNREHYGAEITTLDFSRPEAAQTINAWVSRATKGRIPEIVPRQIDPQTVMFLINAIYFNGTWTNPFDRKLTRDGDWRRPDGRVKRHPMMSRTGEYRVLDGDGFTAVNLPYGSGRLGLYLFLPDAGSDLKAFYARLRAEDWERWMGGFRQQRIMLSLPRFRVEFEQSLNEALKAMGMAVAFDAQRADLGGMLPREFLQANNAYITDVKHKTFMVVNEEGTEAAGATSVEIGIVSAPPAVVFDRPFFLALRDNQTGTLLFVGQIVDPQ